MHPVMHQQQRHRTCFIWLFNPDPFTFDQRQLYRCRIYGQIVDSWLICCRTEWRMRKKHTQCLFQLPVARNMLYQLIKRNLVLRFVLLPRRSFCFHSYKPVARSRSFFAFVLCLFLHNNVLFFVVLFFVAPSSAVNAKNVFCFPLSVINRPQLKRKTNKRKKSNAVMGQVILMRI